MNPFIYPNQPRVRKHGPSGYREYGGYREWLRDEFDFSCVYTLFKETWVGKHNFEIEHVIPQARDSAGERDYNNLVYAYHYANRIKSAKRIPNPCDLVLSECLEVNEAGEIAALSPAGLALMKNLKLDNGELTKMRHDWIRALTLAQEHDPELYESFMGVPADLIDLGSLRPPENSKPEGIARSLYAQLNAANN